MSQQVRKQGFSIRDHLTAYLVLLVIIGVVLTGALVLYLSGIFDPVVAGPPLEDTKLLELNTPPPRGGLLDRLIPSALAENDPPAGEGDEPAQAGTPDEAAAPDAAASAEPAEKDALEQLLEDIAAEGGEGEAGEAAEDGDPEIPASEHVTVEKGDLSQNKNLPEDIYNVLLLATDSRDVNVSRGRSDVMIIASISRTTSEVKLSSFSRDLYVDMAKGMRKNKLNAAYAYGGAELTMKVINELFEMNLSDYAMVNFSAMAGIVDALGGVDIYLEPEEYAHINENVAVSEDYEGFAKSASRHRLTAADQETVVHLDGLQAVGYARIRKLDSDLGRGSRQRVLLQALMDQGMKNISPATFYGLATSLMGSLNTNITLIQVLDVGKWALEADEITMQEFSVPVPDSWHYSRENDMEVIVYNQEANTRALHEFIYGEYIPAAPQ